MPRSYDASLDIGMALCLATLQSQTVVARRRACRRELGAQSRNAKRESSFKVSTHASSSGFIIFNKVGENFGVC